MLPDNREGHFLICSNDMYENTWASVETKADLEEGYKITDIHYAVAYRQFQGLMKDSVCNFI